MLKLLFVSILFSMFSLQGVCQTRIEKSEYSRNGDTVYFAGNKFTGTAVEKAKNGKIIAEEHFVDGLADGFWKEWYSTGEKKFEGGFKSGKNHGEWIQWYENGTIQRKITFENGVPIRNK